MKKLLVLLALVIAAPVTAQDWAKPRLEKSPRHLEWVTVRHGDREVKCFLGFPEVKGKATAATLAVPATTADKTRSRDVASEHVTPTRPRMPANPKPQCAGTAWVSAMPISPVPTQFTQVRK